MNTRGIAMVIEYNPHRLDYWGLTEYLDRAHVHDLFTTIDPEEILRTGDLWVVRWYPNTPVGWCAVAASTLEIAMARVEEA